MSTGQDPAALRHLVEHSATVGTLDERYHGHLVSALELQALTIGDMVRADATPSSVPPQRDILPRSSPNRGPPVSCVCWWRVTVWCTSGTL